MDHTFADLHQHVPFSGPKPIPSLSPRAAATLVIGPRNTPPLLAGVKADIAQRGMALMHVATQIFDQHDLHSMAPLVVIDPCVKEATKTVEHSHLLVQRPSTIMLLDDLPFMNPTFVPFFATVLRTRYEGWKAARDARACEHDLLAWHTIVYMGEDANTATQALSRNQPSLLTLLCVMALPAV